MKTELLGPPEYPYPIRKCVPGKVRWWQRIWCDAFGHVQCGFHWEYNADECCRCGRVE